MKNGKIVGVRSFRSKSGNDCHLAYFTYKDEKDTSMRGDKVGSAFLSDEIVSAIGKRDAVGLSCVIGGRYDKNGNWNDTINAVS